MIRERLAPFGLRVGYERVDPIFPRDQIYADCVHTSACPALFIGIDHVHATSDLSDVSKNMFRSTQSERIVI
jgi:hypothetical protein